ncbi:MAG: phosphotransferase [Clostridiales bacterium]|nr:phosphotransferase [Clostridiales bacterium]
MGIPGSEDWRLVEPVEGGWSGDRKYRVLTGDGDRLLLRVSPGDRRDRKAREFQALCEMDVLTLWMSRPVDFGDCADGRVYTLLTYLTGDMAEEALPALPPALQYRLGIAAGEALRAIHTLPAPPDAEDWAARYHRKIDRKIEMLAACPLSVPGADDMLRFVADHRHLAAGRPQTFQHGDFHVGNLIISGDRVGVIDFDRLDWGDPWEEFNRVVWCAMVSPAFASGRVVGYFGGDPPREFFALMALYVAVNQLSSAPWAMQFGDADVQKMLTQAALVTGWYDRFRTVVPSWYRREG